MTDHPAFRGPAGIRTSKNCKHCLAPLYIVNGVTVCKPCDHAGNWKDRT